MAAWYEKPGAFKRRRPHTLGEVETLREERRLEVEDARDAADAVRLTERDRFRGSDTTEEAA